MVLTRSFRILIVRECSTAANSLTSKHGLLHTGYKKSASRIVVKNRNSLKTNSSYKIHNRVENNCFMYSSLYQTSLTKSAMSKHLEIYLWNSNLFIDQLNQLSQYNRFPYLIILTINFT